MQKLANHRFPLAVRIISFILVITFLAQDIVWAHPDLFADKYSQNNKLAPNTFFNLKDSRYKSIALFAEFLIENKKDYFDKQKAMLDFSESVRFFIQNNSEDEEAIKYAEKITFAYDTMMNKHSLETEGLKKIIEKLIRKLEKY